MQFKNLLKKVLIILFSIVAVILLIALYFGIANVLTAVLIYFVLFLLISIIIKRFNNSWNKSNLYITYWTVFFCILLLELSLRYITKSNLSYLEANGKFSYYCPFENYKYENYAKKMYYKINDIRLFTSIPNYTKLYNKPEFSYEHVYNSIGLREKELEANTIDTSFTIIGMGDSFTEGVGVPYDSTWIYLLGKKIQKEKKNVLTINGGRSDSDIIYESYKLKNLFLDVFNPRIVLIAINSTDILDIIMRGGQERFVSKSKVLYRKGPWWRYIYSFSHISRFVIHKYFKIKPNYFSESEYLALKSEANQIIEDEIFKNILPMIEGKNITPVFVFLPLEHELKNNNFPLNDIYLKVKDYDSSLAINLYDYLKNDTADYSQFYWGIDMHNNSQGHLYIANVIYKHLTFYQLLNK